MRPFGLPLWAVVLVACVIAPMLVRAWAEAEERRAKDRTLALLQRLGWGGDDPGAKNAAGTRRAAKRGQEEHGSTVRTDR